MIIAGGLADHIHLLVSMGRMDIGVLVGDIKRDSSVWIKEQDPQFAKFYWQRGYGAFSVSQSNVAAVSTYIQNQKEHHKKQTFEDEFRELCRKYEVELTSGIAGSEIGPLQGPECLFRRNLGFHPRLYRFVAVGDKEIPA